MEQLSVISPEDAVSFSSLYNIPTIHLLPNSVAGWGTLKFHDTVNQVCSDDRQFVYVDENIDPDVLYKFMVVEWKLKPPNIVISVLNGITNHKPFKSQKMIDALGSGIKKIVDSSEVCFITNGIDVGLPQLIGTVVQESIALRRADDTWALQMDRPTKDWKALTLIAIVCDDVIKDAVKLLMNKGKKKTDIKIHTNKRDKYSLNSDHTHYIIVREKQPTVTNTVTDCDEKLIDLPNSSTNQFRDRFETFLHKKVTRLTKILSSPSTTDAKTDNTESPINIGFPMMYLLIRGSIGTIEILYQKVQQEIPIVILKGTGSAADIVSFVYDEISAKTNKNFEDDNLKTELARRLLDEYPALKNNHIKRSEIRNHIIDIVKKNEQSKPKFLTIIDVNSSAVSLNDLHKFIFTGYAQSKKIVIGDKPSVHMQNNLVHLAVEWGLVDLAQSEIFHREDFIGYTIPNSLFEQAVLSEDLEAFVDLFLERDFVLHRYLTLEKLRSLFNREKDRDFFTITSLEGILGWSGDDTEVPQCFIEHSLNDIVYRLTGHKKVFSKHEIKCNSIGIYFGQKTSKSLQRQQMLAETRALRYLVIYAVLTSRHNLAKILWKRSSEPIPLALICCMMYNKLIPYCRESYLQSLVKKQAKEFSDCAIGVLNKSAEENETRVFEMLNTKHPDWNDMTVVQLAYNADNKEFMSHSILQKWITRKFYGEITPRELSWGLFTTPDYLKIILSVFLIFPMWFWISFSPIGQASKKKKDLPDTKPGDIDVDAYTRQTSIIDGRNCFQRLKSEKCQHKRMAIDEEKKSFIEKIIILWSAPITKFYLSFEAYLIFLVFFTLAVMWPSCGNLFLDCIVWIWAAAIAFENIRVGYIKYCSQSDVPLVGVVIEILLQMIFLSLYLGVRIVGLWNMGTCQILTAKAILGLGLIYYFYRILFVFLPISSKLGPMMIRLQYMVTDDFFTFLRLFAVFMISSGVAITAVLYPHHPLGWELFSKAFFFRGLMALFVSDLTDFKHARQPCTINATTDSEKKYACLRLSQSFQYDDMYTYERYGIPSPLCNQTSWIAWFLLIQYFFLTKRFLISLLTALFGLTGARVQRQSEQIWFFNRYAILVEYSKRPRLPPPFTVISRTIGLIHTVYRHCILKLKRYSDKRNRIPQERARRMTAAHSDLTLATTNPLIAVPHPVVPSSDVKLSGRQLNTTSSAIDDSFCSSLLGTLLSCNSPQNVIQKQSDQIKEAQKYWENSEASTYWKHIAKEYFIQSQAAEKGKDKSSSPVNVQKDIDVLRKSLQQNTDRIVTLEKMMIQSHVLLEKICAMMPQENKASSDSLKKFVHIHSRLSPYVYTNDARFPVIEKFVPWETSFELYDPPLITLPKEHICFSDNDRPFVDPDLVNLSSAELSSSKTIESPVTTDFSIPLSKYKWNEIVELQLSNDKKIIVDRTTWITQPNDKTPIVYQLGPRLLVPLNPFGRTGVRGRGALIRWGPNKSVMAIITRWKKLDNEFVTVEGRKILEAMVFVDKNTNNCKFCEAKMLGEESSYSTICRVFSELAFQNSNYEHSSSFQEQNMIEFFESFAHSKEFESHMVYRGYIDDVRNTDNAWMETEVWNFHYGATVSFPQLRIDDGSVTWKNVTHSLRGVSIQTSILRDIARIHDAYFD